MNSKARLAAAMVILAGICGFILLSSGVPCKASQKGGDRTPEQPSALQMDGKEEASLPEEIEIERTDLEAKEEGQGAKIEWLHDYDLAVERAKKDGKLIFIDFFAVWCMPCRMLDRTTFQDTRVADRMNAFVPLKIDTDREVEIAARFEIQGLPTLAIVDSDGKPITNSVGYLTAEQLLELLASNTPDTRPAGSASPP